MNLVLLHEVHANSKYIILLASRRDEPARAECSDFSLHPNPTNETPDVTQYTPALPPLLAFELERKQNLNTHRQ